MNKKPYNNKPDYDPGRFISTISFYKQISTPDGSGGSDLIRDIVYTCEAAEKPLREGDQLVINAGASLLNQDKWLIIRFFKSFTPMKDMNISENGVNYVLRAVVPDGMPIKYFKLLCVKKDG